MNPMKLLSFLHMQMPINTL